MSRPHDRPGAESGPDAVADESVLDELSLVFGSDDPGGGPEEDQGGEQPDDQNVDQNVEQNDGEGDEGDQDEAAAQDDREGDEGDQDQNDADQNDADQNDADQNDADQNDADRGDRNPTPPVLIDPGLQSLARPDAADDAVEVAPTSSGHTFRIGDGEQPEIRYLDEELGADSERDGPVFIDDDDTDDAIVASEAGDRNIDGRLRQRRIGVARAMGLRRLRWLLLGAGLVVLLIAVVAVLASSLFSVNQITVVGNRYSDPDALKAVIVGLDGTPVLLVDTSGVEEELEAIPWVEDARVRTSFPNSATIEIRERTAVTAMPGSDGMTRVLDKEGRVLDLIDGQPIALVWISGPITLDIPAGHFASPGPTWASALVPKFTPTIRPRVESMQVTPDGSDLRVYLRPANPEPADGGAVAESDEETILHSGPLIEVRFGSATGDNEQIEKLVRLERVLDDIGTQRVRVIDVSTAEVTVL